MEEPQTDDRPRRSRGVRLSDLDRSKPWVIGYTGRRWEVLGSIRPGLSVVEDLEVGLGSPECGCGGET